MAGASWKQVERHYMTSWDQRRALRHPPWSVSTSGPWQFWVGAAGEPLEPNRCKLNGSGSGLAPGKAFAQSCKGNGPQMTLAQGFQVPFPGHSVTYNTQLLKL